MLKVGLKKYYFHFQAYYMECLNLLSMEQVVL